MTDANMHNDPDLDRPGISMEAMQRLAAGELSSRSRLGYILLLLVTLAAAGVTSSLWLTEPSLPSRTHVGFALIVGINLCWVAYAAWVLTKRRVLLAGHEVIAGRMAVTFSAVLVALFVLLGLFGPMGTRAYAAAGFGLVMLVAAVAVLIRARGRFRQLMERRQALEREIEKRGRTRRSGEES